MCCKIFQFSSDEPTPQQPSMPLHLQQHQQPIPMHAMSMQQTAPMQLHPISKPNFDEMQKLNIIVKSASKYDDIGAILLKEKEGEEVGNMRAVARDDPQKIVRAIYQQWMQEDEDCSWEKLVWCLRRVRLNPLATEIEQCFRLPQRQHPMPYQQQQHPRRKKCLLA